MNSKKIWPWVVIVVTLIYLVVETSFSAELLNIVGQKASTADITSIEHWGRYISGFAAGLVLWSFITPSLSIFGRHLSVKRALIINLIVTASVMMFVYHWEMQIVNTAKANNSGVQRKEAVYAAFVRNGLLNGTVMLTGMPHGHSEYSSPEGKAFIALLPLLADSDGHLSNKLSGVLRDVVKNNIVVQTAGAQGYYDHIFLPVAHRMATAWVNYQGMVGHLNSGYRAADNAPDQERVAMIQSANARFQATFRKAFSLPGEVARVNPAGVSNAQDFFALPSIRRLWAHELRVPMLHQALLPSATYSEVHTSIWPMYLKAATEKELHTFQSHTADFRDGGPYARRGQNATVLLTVPALALILSVIGMLIHSAKLVYYTQKVMARNENHQSGWTSIRTAGLRLLIALIISGCIAGLFYMLPNSITQAALYHHLIVEYQDKKAGMWPSWMLTWIIQAERVVYPVAEFLLQHLPYGFHFGVKPIAFSDKF